LKFLKESSNWTKEQIDKYQLIEIKRIINHAYYNTKGYNQFYNKIGFNLVSTTSPNYWYFNHDTRYHRFNFRKDQLSKKLKQFDAKLTEWENMQVNRYDRIWDCGSIKYEKILTFK
jgi:hypothetical protein